MTTSSGEHIDRITIEERFARSDEVKKTTLRGDRLRAAVDLMDKHGVMNLKGDYEAEGVALASGTVTLIVEPASGEERRIVVESCVQENVCAFFDDAVADGLVERKPVACKSEVPCAR